MGGLTNDASLNGRWQSTVFFFSLGVILVHPCYIPPHARLDLGRGLSTDMAARRFSLVAVFIVVDGWLAERPTTMVTHGTMGLGR